MLKFPLFSSIDQNQTDETQPLNVQDNNDYVSDGASTSTEEINEDRTVNEILPTDGDRDMYLHLDEGDILNNREKVSFANRKIFSGFYHTNSRVAIEIIDKEYLSEQRLFDFKNIFEDLKKMKHENVIGDYYYEWNASSW